MELISNLFAIFSAVAATMGPLATELPSPADIRVTPAGATGVAQDLERLEVSPFNEIMSLANSKS